MSHVDFEKRLRCMSLESRFFHIMSHVEFKKRPCHMPYSFNLHVACY